MLESLTVNEQLRARLESATRLGALGVDARDLLELFRALYDETTRVLDATVFLFAVYDEASETVEVVRQVDRGVEHEGGSFPLGKGFTSEVIRTKAPRLGRHRADHVGRCGARGALRAELSSRGIRRRRRPESQRDRGAGGHRDQTSSSRGPDGTGASEARAAARGRAREHE